MHVMTKGFCGDMPVANQAWNTKMVTYLMNGAKGDLMLDHHGNLTSRVTYDTETFDNLPFNQHKAGEVLALIGQDGWLLTRAGARYILENLSIDSERGKRTERMLEALAA